MFRRTRLHLREIGRGRAIAWSESYMALLPDGPQEAVTYNVFNLVRERLH